MEWLAILIAVIAIMVAVKLKSSEAKRRSPPLLRPEDIQPADEPISLTDAKKIYLQILNEYTDLDREDIAEAVRMFAEESAERMEDCKQDARDQDDEIKEYRQQISALKAKLKATPDDDELLEELEDAEACLAVTMTDKQDSLDEAAAHRKDKRKFLIDYINSEFHGGDWRMQLEESASSRK